VASDRVELLLREFEADVRPSPEFAEVLFARLERELEAPQPRPFVAPLLRWPRVGAPAAVALVVVLALVAVLVVRPVGVSAAEVVRRAGADLAQLTQVRATIVYDLNPDGSSQDVPRGATAEVEVTYVRGVGYRGQIARTDPALLGNLGAGSYVVWDGKRLGSYRADQNFFFAATPHEGYEPLRELSWNTPYPNWEDICRRGGSETLADATIAGRTAHHVRCGDWRGGFWELWIDAETGFMLKIAGPLGRDDFKLGTSERGGFEVTRIEYAFTVDPERFTVTPPPGARTTPQPGEARMPALRATVVRRWADGSSYRHVVSYRNENAWRRDVLEDSRPGDASSGSFWIWDGQRTGAYFARSHSFQIETRRLDEWHPGFELHPAAQKLWPAPGGSGMPWDEYRAQWCKSAERETVAGRAAEHLSCEGHRATHELWLDAETGLILKFVARVKADAGTPGPTTVPEGVEWEILAIEYAPPFPEGTFIFTPPAGARDVRDVASDPYKQTGLRKGEIAPSWSGTLLDGSTLRLEQTRGRPLLVLFWADWCPRGDPACDVLRQFDEISRGYADRARFVSVDLGGSRDEAGKIMRDLGYRFAVIDDASGDVAKSWGVEAVPIWVLLDGDGRVVEVRLRPQTVQQLEDMLRAAGL
jgi:thiol-disulfide isomerase/thioredoxin